MTVNSSDNERKAEIPTDLVQALADIVVLKGGVDSIRSELDQEAGNLATLTNVVNDIKKNLEKPWYRDIRFWAGISTIPGFILGGWIIKAATSDPSLLRLIHRGFGTEVAIEASLKDQSDLEKSVANVIQQKLSPGAKDFDTALVQNLSSKFATTSSLSEMVGKRIEADTNIKHVDLLTLGLVRPHNAFWRPCELSENSESNGKCLDVTRDAFVDSATSIFGAERGYKINVSIGVFVRETKTEHLPNKADFQPVTGAVPLNDLLKIEIDDVTQMPQKQRDSFNYTFGGKNYVFAHYELDGLQLPDDSGFTNFPLHTISVTALPGASNKVISMALVVRKAK